MDRAEAIERLEIHRKACGFPMMPHMESASAAADWVMRMELLSEALSLGIAALREQWPKWISVEERLPGVNEDVWCYSNKNGGYMFIGYIGYLTRDWIEGGSLHIGDVTHWMPLPEPPKEGAEG